jgi:hypothetical protein
LHWSITVSFPSGRVRYITSSFRLAELLGEDEPDEAWTAREKAARRKEKQEKEPPKELVNQVQAQWERQQWQHRFLAAEAAARRPVQRPKLALPIEVPDTTSTTQEDSQ